MEVVSRFSAYYYRPTCSYFCSYSRARHLPAAATAHNRKMTFSSCDRGAAKENKIEAVSMSKSIQSSTWYALPEFLLRDHHISVPLDYSSVDSAHITLFVREIIAAGKKEQRLPYLLFLQGGPGFESPRPHEVGEWLKKACKEFRVILLDQRGTGLSTPLSTSSLSQFSTIEEQTNFLQHFRADSIVKDAEFVRSCLDQDKEPWTVLGQSYGGFCAVTYLSFASAGLKQVLLTGGLPPLNSGCSAELVYRLCYKQVIEQNKKFYKRFPDAVKLVQEIVLFLHNQGDDGVVLPSGSKLSPQGLQLLGLSGLGSSRGFERLYYMLERAWDPILVPGAPKRLSTTFFKMFENWLAFDTNPLYALMHESIYCQGGASNWAAHRIRDEFKDQFDAVRTAKCGEPVFFTGEMVFPWMFDEFAALRPLKKLANLLATNDVWPPLYDEMALRANQVPVAAAVYFEDMYVSFSLSMETAKAINGIRLWVTNEYMHSGLRDDGGRILDYLFDMLGGKKLLE